MGLGLNFNQKVQIGEHVITLPDAPKKKEDVLFIDQCKEDAFWQRLTDYPKIWEEFIPYRTLVDCIKTKYDDNTGELLQLNHEDSNEIRRIYKQERERRKNGIFFRNGDDLEYLTGSNYFTLQHCKMFGNTRNNGYGNFYKYQRDIFYLLDKMWESWCLGLYISKAKTTGITQIIDGGYCVDKATSQFQWLIGFMSRNEDVVVETNMKLFLHAFDSLALALKPRVGYKAPKGGNIEFSELMKKNVIRAKKDEVLDTKVFCAPTAEHSFDSYHFMNIIRLDEFPKYFQDRKKEPQTIFDNNKAGAKDQDLFIGRVIISSYPPEVDDIGSEQGAEIFRQSKLSTRRAGSLKTASELICYHIPAYKSLKSCIDKYGNCDEKKALDIIGEERQRAQHDKKKLLALTRQNPNNEIEAFGSNTQGAVFDPIRLTEILYGIEVERKNSPRPPYIEGKLEWENWKWELGLHNRRPRGQFCPVKFIPLTDDELARGEQGRLRIYHDLNDNEKNSCLKNGRDENDCLLPPLIFKNILGGDPTQHAAASEVIQGSKNAYIVKSRIDTVIDAMYGRPQTGIITMEYFDRPELPDEAYEDLVKLIIYTGSLAAIEANAPEFATRLINEGLGYFMIVKDEAGNFCIWERWMGLPNEEDKKYHLLRTTSNSPQSKEILEAFVRLIKMFIQRPEKGEKDYGKTIKSERIIKQLMKADMTDTKLLDLLMALGYCFLGDDIYTGLLLQGTEEMYVGNQINAVLAAFER